MDTDYNAGSNGIAPESADNERPAEATAESSLSCADQLALALLNILNMPIYSGTVGENYLPKALKDEADRALARWERRTRTSTR